MAKAPNPDASVRKCLFCEGNGSSGEHLWPRWMRNYFVRTAHDARADGYLFVSKTNPSVSEVRKRHGHTTTTKIKVVCRTCNHGWMSRLEVQARPHIESMLRGAQTELDTQAAQTVARWITLKMMVLEGESERDAAFRREETLAFAATQNVPDRVFIWLSKTAEREMKAYLWRSFANLSHRANGAAEKANVQTTVFVAGRLVAFFLFNRADSLKFAEPRRSEAKALWPISQTPITWPPFRAIAHERVQYMANALRRFVEARGFLR